MRVILPVDSRVSDTAGIVFYDPVRNLVNIVPVVTRNGQTTRNGFRGGVLIGSQLFVCTSSALMVLDVDWPQGGTPTVSVRRAIFRDEWLTGGRANADLHHVYFDDGNNCVLVANSFMDSIDYFDLNGNFLDRRHLWDISPELKELAKVRRNGVADLCHVNHISRLGNEIILTLGNLNGSRKGGILSLTTGKIIRSDLDFPHDGISTKEGFWVTEATTQRITLFNGDSIQSGDLSSAKRSSWVVAPHAQDSASKKGNIWVRGLAFEENRILVGCSQFDDVNSLDSNEKIATHIAMYDRSTMASLGAWSLPALDQLKAPVVYSIILSE